MTDQYQVLDATPTLPKRLTEEGQRILDRIALLPQNQIKLLIKQIGQILHDVEFNTWMRAVDVCLAEKVPLTHKDLVDQPYREWFDSGMPPRQAVDEALQDEGFFDEEDEFDW